MSNKASTWWAQSRSRAQATAAAFVAFTLVLVGISAFVWASPSNAPVRNAVDQAVAAVNPLSGENAQLKKDLAAANDQLTRQKLKVAAAQAKALATASSKGRQLAEALKRANMAEASLAAVKAEFAKAGAGTSTASTGTPTVGSKPATEPAVITAPSKAALAAPASRYFGMFTEQAPFNWATFDATSAKIGVQPNLVGYFSGWDETFRANAVTRAWQQGRLPMMTWESRPIDAGNDSTVAPAYSLPNIIAGNFDAYLHQYAKDIVATGLPLAIRLDHEMNGVWYPWSETDGAGNSINGNNVGDYVKMWRHVHDIFQQEGANKLVIWVWSPNIVNNLPAKHTAPGYLQSLYPGDDYVDWVGLSGYLRPPYKSDNDFSFDYTFKASLNQLRALTAKPKILSEVGASETGGHKATWITSFFNSLAKPENSDVIGFSWFDLAVTSYVEGVRATNDWRIDSRADTLAAFIAGITKPEDNFTLTPSN